jgi:hypothetical protein
LSFKRAHTQNQYPISFDLQSAKSLFLRKKYQYFFAFLFVYIKNRTSRLTRKDVAQLKKTV